MDILLADDQPHVRSALRLLLEQDAHARIVGEVGTVQDLLSCAGQVAPDAILVDWELPGLSPVEGISSMRRAYPQARIMALSSRPEARQAALQAGVDAFVSKAEPPERLLAELQPTNERERQCSGIDCLLGSAP
jgi:DNA-binding NarL/FixJ family response regulator